MTQPHFGQLPAARHMRRKRFSDVRPAALPEAGPASVSSPDASPRETAPADQDAPTASDPASPNAGSTVEASESGNVQAERTSAPGTDQRAELHRRKKLVALILVILVVLVIVTLSLALVFLG
ncbi:MAG: hypothetical protein JWO93_2866 [Micrococcaceae bacterium]|nr:hypothetical protein [Micrococcaceae bacterium]